MDSLLCLSTITLTSLLLLFFNKLRWRPNLPPSPWQLPIIGNIHQVLSGQLPHHRLRQLSDTHGPLMYLKLGEVSMIVASSPEAACEITKTHDHIFATRPLYPAMDVLSYHGKTVSFGPYGAHWRQLRRICTLELLSMKRVASFRSIRAEEARNLVESISSSSRRGSLVNLSKAAVKMAYNVTTRAVMGDRFEDQERFMRLLNDLIELSTGFDLADLFPSMRWLLRRLSRAEARVAECQEERDNMLSGIVREHREWRKKKKASGQLSEEQEAEDFVDVMLRLQEEGDKHIELTDDSIKALISDMLGGGSETSSSVIQWAMSELMVNPHTMRKAQAELRDTLRGKDKVTEDDVKGLKYLELLVKETLRLHPPGPLLLPRECQKNCKVFGYDVPARARVVVNAWAIGRDPKHWEDAEEFKPERFEGSSIDFKGTNFEFLPFGAGRRICPGMQFGLGVVELALANLLYHFDWELPDSSGGLNMSEAFGISSHLKFDLMLRATPYVLPK